MSEMIEAAVRLEAARAKAVSWLLDLVGPNGCPEGWEQGNGWSRLPWTLALVGETGVAAAVLEWAARETLDASGSFREGPALGAGAYAGGFNAYKIGQFAMGALLLERYDVANLVLDYLQNSQQANGGMQANPLDSQTANITEMCNTAQTGLAALLGGRMGMAEGCRNWVVNLLHDQPKWPHVLYAGRIGDDLPTEFEGPLSFMLAVDYRKPRQAYHQAGVAAAFLSAYAMRTGDSEALAAVHRYLAYNIQGSEEQFSDLGSVQACKFGWGVALAQIADPPARYEQHLLRMADWFIDRQADDGSWTFSPFLMPSPTIVEYTMKTAEHSMEVTALIAALRVSASRRA